MTLNMHNDKQVYLDNNATSMVSPAAVEAMMPFWGELYGNPSSMHSFGGRVASFVSKARSQVAALINADPSEIIFTSCGTEADNHAIRGTIEAESQKKHIVTTCVEHPAVLKVCRYLAQKKGCTLTELSVDNKGNLNLDELKSALTPDTAILSVMYANNETGVIFPIEKIAQIAKEKGVIFHTDAVQAVGKLNIDVKKLNIDMLSVSGHKLHAPKGIGFLYIKKGTKTAPFMLGGHQESSRRAGTENVPYIVALGKACEEALNDLQTENKKIAFLRDKLEKGLLSKIDNAHINGDTQNRLCNTTNIGFEAIEGEAILLNLSAAGIAASSGSACTSGSLEPSHVLMAMKTPFTYAHGSIRFSLSKYNTEEEIDYVIEKFPAIVQKLRAMSPFYHPGK